MRSWVTAVAVAGLCGSGVFGQSPPEDAAKAGIRELFQQMTAAVQRRDRLALQQLLTPDFRFVHANGPVTDRDAQTDLWLKGVGRTDEPSFEPPTQFLLDGNTAILIRGGGQLGQLVFTTIFVRNGGRWRVRHTQSTRISALPDK